MDKFKIDSHKIESDPIQISFKRIEKLKSGENPYQQPAYLCQNLNSNFDGYSLIKFKRMSEEGACYTNLADLNNLLDTLYLASSAFNKYYNKVPYISIAGKHGNPCGLSIDWESPAKTVKQALWGNPRAIWGGEFVANFYLTADLAFLLHESDKRRSELGKSKWMLDVVSVPEIDEEAKELLERRKRTKIYISKSLYLVEKSKNYTMIKSVRGGFLIQPNNTYVLDFSHLEWTDAKINKKYVDSIIIAWAVAYSSFHGGNEVAVVKNNKLIGVGGGPSTVEAVKIAVWRASENNHSTENSVFAADAFFPFTDALEILKEARCVTGVVPAGGMNHKKIEKFFKDNNIKCGFIPEIYRGFCRH